MDAKLTCIAPKDGVLFGDRCGKDADYMTPTGAKCGGCAEEEMKAIREGSCLLAMISDQRGVPRQRLLDQYRRIQ